MTQIQLIFEYDPAGWTFRQPAEEEPYSLIVDIPISVLSEWERIQYEYDRMQEQITALAEKAGRGCRGKRIKH